jgi:hypothetical protein
MKTPVLIGLAAVTVVAVVAAAAVVRDRSPAAAAGAGGTPVFPAIAAKPEEVAQLVVTRADGGYTLTRKGEQWVLADRADYPVRAEQAKQAVAALVTLKLMEPKTQKPELLARLEVEEPTQPGAKSTLVTLKDAQGQELGRIILGKARPDSLENPRPGVYARKPGDARAWLAEGDPKIRPAVSDWLDRQVLAVKTERVREIATIAPDRARLVVTRDKAEDKDFKIYNLPEGTKVKNQSTLNDLAGLLDSLMMDDVQGATAIAFPASGASQAEFRTFDGLVVRLTIAEDKGATWARVEAVTEPWRKVEGDKSTMVDPTDEVKKEADGLNARLRNHVFKLTDYTAKKLVSRLGDLTEKDEKKEEKKP